MGEHKLRPLRRIRTGRWLSADGKWKFCRGIYKGRPAWWVFRVGEPTGPANLPNELRTLREAVDWVDDLNNVPD